MAEGVVKLLKHVADLLEAALEEKDWDLVEEALDELRSVVEGLEG